MNKNTHTHQLTLSQKNNPTLLYYGKAAGVYSTADLSATHTKKGK